MISDTELDEEWGQVSRLFGAVSMVDEAIGHTL
jgi:hypothetical protein